MYVCMNVCVHVCVQHTQLDEVQERRQALLSGDDVLLAHDRRRPLHARSAAAAWNSSLRDSTSTSTSIHTLSKHYRECMRMRELKCR